MELEPAAWAILSNLMRGSKGASLSQIRMWLIPQKAEHEYSYSINNGYFDMLLHATIKDLMSRGYVRSTLPDGVEDADTQVFSLTDTGAEYIEMLAKQADGALIGY